MDVADRHAIEGLFQRLVEVGRRAPPRDAEAEALIRRAILAEPGAPYHMAQAILAQDAALAAVQARIEALEAGEGRGGGFFSGVFGGASTPEADRRGPEGGAALETGRGFLGGAARTALGVAGGLLAGQALARAFAAAAAVEDLSGDATPLGESDAEAPDDMAPPDDADPDEGGDAEL